MTDRALRITYVAGGFPPARSYGGPAESSYRLCIHLQLLGAQVRVLAYGTDGRASLNVPLNRWSIHEGLSVFYGKRFGTTHLTPRLFGELPEAWEDADIIHVSCGLSALMAVATLRGVARSIPVVFSPRGSLLPEALARHRWRKTLFRRIGGDTLLRRVGAFHATAAPEASAIAELFPDARVYVIPNGVLVPPMQQWPHPLENEDFAGPWSRELTTTNRPPFILYLGRIHPHKQVDWVIEAFSRARVDSTVQLWIAGDGRADYVAGLGRRAAALGVAERVRWLGHVGGSVKSSLLGHAEALLLASRSENFGMSVAEALAHGTPCVVTKTAPWAQLEREGGGFWVDNSIDALRNGIEQIMARGDRRAMGERGRRWMAREYSWGSIAARMLAAYGRLLDG